jgi:hypothetical protein
MDGFWERFAFAFQCFFSILFRGEIPADSVQKLAKPRGSVPQMPATAVPSASGKDDVKWSAAGPFDRAVQMLALLQRDGRLVDFLREDISAYPDVELGVAVRTIHETCRKALDHYVKLEPILNSPEDQPVTVQAGFDASAIKLIGNVAGKPPLRGVLRHKGWRVKEVNLPPLLQGVGRMVVTPAEVELS